MNVLSLNNLILIILIDLTSMDLDRFSMLLTRKFISWIKLDIKRRWTRISIYNLLHICFHSLGFTQLDFVCINYVKNYMIPKNVIKIMCAAKNMTKNKYYVENIVHQFFSFSRPQSISRMKLRIFKMRIHFFAYLHFVDKQILYKGRKLFLCLYLSSNMNCK